MKKILSSWNIIAALLLLLLLCLLFSSCKATKDVMEVPVYIHDTTYINKEVHDSTYIDRWHTIYEKGDTVYSTDSMVFYKYITRHDTTYQYVEKPVEVIKEVEVEVEKRLPWWKDVLMFFGVILLLGVGGWMIMQVVIHKLK